VPNAGTKGFPLLSLTHIVYKGIRFLRQEFFSLYIGVIKEQSILAKRIWFLKWGFIPEFRDHPPESRWYFGSLSFGEGRGEDLLVICQS